MTIKSIQKVIKVGSSLAVTIPARDAKQLGIKAGDNVISTVKIEQRQAEVPITEISTEYEAFKKAYSTTLKNLAGR